MRRSSLVHLLTMLAILILVTGCSNDRPTQPAGPGGTDHHIIQTGGGDPSAPDQLFGRAAEVRGITNTIILEGTRTEVIVKSGASIMLADRESNTTAPLTLSGIKLGDSLEFQGAYISRGTTAPLTKGTDPGNTEGRSDDIGSPALFSAENVTVIKSDTVNVPPDTLPLGLTLAFDGILRTVDLDQGTITFTNRLYTGQTTAQTVYNGMFMGPIITLANFAPDMHVRIVGKTAGNWILNLDSLIQLPSDPPDTTEPSDTLPIGTPLQFYTTIATVDHVAHTVTFIDWPYTGEITEFTNIVLTSLIECSTMRDCVWPGMRVQAFGRTAGNWTLTLDSLLEQVAPPDSTIPPDSTVPPDTVVPPDSTIPPDTIPSGSRIIFSDQIQRVDTMSGTVWFTSIRLVGTVTPETYYAGEFVPGTIPSLRNFLPGSYVHVSGITANGGLVIDTLILNDFLPPDSTTPPDTTTPPDSTVPPDTVVPGDSSYTPITGTIFFDLVSIYSPDSLGGWVIDIPMETEELFSCPNTWIAGMFNHEGSDLSYVISGVPPFECAAYQPGPAKGRIYLRSDLQAFTLTFIYWDKIDQYNVTIDANHAVTVTPIGTPTFTLHKDL